MHISQIACKLSGKQEPQHVPKTVRPGMLIVDRPLRLHIDQINPAPPTPFEQQTLQHVRIAQMPHSFRRPHIQPDAQLGLRRLIVDRIEDTAMVPP